MSTATDAPQNKWDRWIPTPPVMAAWGVLLLAFVWNYWSTMFQVVRVWSTTPEMGHGFVVPLFAAYLLWRRQEMVDPWPNRGTLWCIPFFVVFALIRLANLWLRYERDIDSLIPFLFGMTLALGGWRAFRWAWPSILFLIFMVPLPSFVAEAAALPLQRVATIMSVYTLQTVGISAFAMGQGSNVIQIPTPPQLEVERACSGLSMLTVFYAMCIGACFIIREPLWKKLIVIASAAPIAVICNVARISVAGMLQEWINPDVGRVFHDYFGMLEVIPGILLIWGELALISALLIEPVTEGPLVFCAGGGGMKRQNPATGKSMAGLGGVGPISGTPRGPRQT